jgi:hypothetical protein
MERAIVVEIGSRPWRIFAGIVCALALFGSLACSSLTDPGRPKNARVVLTGSPSVTLELVTSQNFLVTEGTVQLVTTAVDTATVPVDRTFRLGVPARFYVRSTNLEDHTVTVTMKVFIGGRIWHNESKSLATGESVEFIYRYDEPVIR